MYSFYFEQDGEKILLPVPPSSIEMKINNSNRTLNLLNLGDVNVLKNTGLTDVSFEIMLPSQPYSFAAYTNKVFKEPAFFLEKLKQYKKSKKPIQLRIERGPLVGRSLFEQIMLVSLESYTLKEQAGEEGDIYVSLELKEYKEYLPQYVDIYLENGEAVAIVEQARAAKESQRQYSVKRGDTLWAIAKKELNDGSRHIEIAKLNSITDPNRIYPGQILQLP